MIAISKSDAEQYGCPHCQHPIDFKRLAHGATDSALNCASDACKQPFIICSDGQTESFFLEEKPPFKGIKVQPHPFAPVAPTKAAEWLSGKGLTRDEIDAAIQKATGLPPLSPLARRILAGGDDLDRPTHESEAERKHRRRGRG